jgi:SAM-dependent methyltransferase
MIITEYTPDYYRNNKQDADRPALWYYTRLACRYIQRGTVLDFGHGTGHFLRRLARHFQVEGFEVSAYGRERAKELVPQSVFYSDLAEIPNNRYEGITALHVLEHLDDATLHETLAVWNRALSTGGRVLCVVPELDGRGHRLKKDAWCGFGDPSHSNLKTREMWLLLFRSMGFTIIATGTDGLWDFPYYRKNRHMDIILHGAPTLIQFLLGRLVLPVSSGESLVVIMERSREICPCL